MSSRFWEKTSSSHSGFNTQTEYATPEDLWSAVSEYMSWCEATPVETPVSTFYLGDLKTGFVHKPRAMSVSAMCRFIGLTKNEWTKLKNSNESFLRACTLVEDAINSQLYELAAADVLNANFVARAIGLSDKQVVAGPGVNGEHYFTNTLDVSGLDLDQLDVLQEALIASLSKKEPE